MSKDKRIKKEYDRLSAIYAELDTNKREAVEGIIQNAAFMAITLEDLQEQINAEGAVISSVNGNGFKTIQEHPAQKSYNTMINRYNASLKQLAELAPTATKRESKLSELLGDE